MKRLIPLLPCCLLLGACAERPAPVATGVPPPARWQAPVMASDDAALQRDWWRRFGSTDLDGLIERARAGNHDVAVALARVRQARAMLTVAGAPLLPEVRAGVEASREGLLSGQGNRDLDASEDDPRIDSFLTDFNVRYDVDLWGGREAARDSALQGWHASRFERAAVELSVLAEVANRYLDVRALDEQARIAALNLDNAREVLALVETRHEAGAATPLEVAQQRSLVARQQRLLPEARQRAAEARIALATLLGEPVQALRLAPGPFNDLRWPTANAGVPSELLARRPDIAAAEARLASAEADVRVARAALLPSLTLGANLGSGGERASQLLRSPFYTLTAGLAAPIFDNGRLSAERDRVQARQEEVLEDYRQAIVAAFADVETALVAIDGLDRQREGQARELESAHEAFRLAGERYRAGAETLLTLLESQRTLYEAQTEQVHLHLARAQASVALYKALGGGWRAEPPQA